MLPYYKILWLVFFFVSLHVEFSRRWCTLNDGTFSYYESDKNSNPNGALKASEIVCLAADTPERHGYAHTNWQNDFFFFLSLLFFHPPFHFLLNPRYDHTFELYSESERLYLFGTDDPDSHKEWVKSIAKVTTKYTLVSWNTSTNSQTFSSDRSTGEGFDK